MKRTFDGVPKSTFTTSEQEDKELIKLLDTELRTLTSILTQHSVKTFGAEFEPIDAMNELIDQAERNRNEGKVDSMKSNLRQLHEACLRLDVNYFGGGSLMNTALMLIKNNSAKYANFVVSVKQVPAKTTLNIEDIEQEIKRHGALNRLDMYNKRRRVAGRTMYRSKARRTYKKKRAARDPGTKVRVILNKRNARGRVAKLLMERPRNLILHLQSVSSYTFMVKGGNRPEFATISRADVTIEPVLFMDKPSRLTTGMLVQVKYANKPWWTGKFMESHATTGQIKHYLKELKRTLAALNVELAELITIRAREKTGPNRPKWMALNSSYIDEKKQEINQYKHQYSRKYKQLQLGTYVVEDDVAAFRDPTPESKRREFVPNGDNSDKWKFPDCPLVSMESNIEILNSSGVWQRAEVTQIGDTNSRVTDPEHVFTYKLEDDQDCIVRQLDTWFQQYRLCKLSSLRL
jgi:hypothetical protein